MTDYNKTMGDQSATILIADDQQDIREALRLLLTSKGFVVMQADNPAEILEVISQAAVNLVLLDMNYRRDTTSGQEGLELLKQARQFDPHLPIIAMTAWGSVDLAMRAVRQGANDFIEKPWDNNRLVSIINAQLDRVFEAENKRRYQTIARLQRDHFTTEIIAESAPMQQLLTTLRQVAPSQASIMLRGENGTGKNLLAEQVHAWSDRADGPLVSVNMGSIPENLFESEMFGHVRGAFTDAREARTGRFELADGGTLFLDEIGNLPLPQQAKLLRVLESGSFEKLGASKTQTVDVRIVTASNADLPAMVESGEFRRDLYFRLNTVEVTIPPIRERNKDVLLLAEYYLEKHQRRYNKLFSGFSRDAEQVLLSYSWPGNVRELSHVVERAVLLGQAEQLSVENLNLPLDGHDEQPAAQHFSSGAAKIRSLEEVEKQQITEALQHYSGNVVDAAKALGVSRSAMYRRMEKFGLDAGG